MVEHAMAHGEIWTIKELFTYPNEYIYWTIHIAIYPYITGLVAGAFVLSSFYHVFGMNELKPVARFSLVFSLALLIIAPTPLLFHLTQPQRNHEMILTPHFYSAIASFTVVYMTYMFIVLAEIWFAYRAFIVEQAKTCKGLMGTLYKAMTLGAYDVSKEALHTDHRMITILAAAGIPAAGLLHGYVGFIFGSVKAVPYWKTPLMPFVFLMSAVISGVALCIATYVIISKLTKRAIKLDAVKAMSGLLGWFLIVAFLLEGVDLIFHGYLAEEFWPMLSIVIFDKLFVKMFVMQWGLGMVLPFILLMLPRLTVTRAFISSVLVIIGVFMMRMNVIQGGGQGLSKSLSGFMTYTLPIIPTNLETFKEGLAAVIILLSAPFILLYIFNKILPIFQSDDH